MKKLVVLAVCIVFIAGSAYGAMIQRGARELGVSGDLQFESEDGQALDLAIYGGQFIVDGVQVGVFAGIFNSDSITSWDVGLYGEYNLDLNSELVPFAGVFTGYCYFNPSWQSRDDVLLLGAYAGLKYFLVENCALSLYYEFEWASEDIYFDNGNLEDTNNSLKLGLAVFF